jgi:hypothetical protein
VAVSGTHHEEIANAWLANIGFQQGGGVSSAAARHLWRERRRKMVGEATRLFHGLRGAIRLPRRHEWHVSHYRFAKA